MSGVYMSGVCVTPSALSGADWPQGPKTLWDPNLAGDPEAFCTTVDLGL